MPPDKSCHKRAAEEQSLAGVVLMRRRCQYYVLGVVFMRRRCLGRWAKTPRRQAVGACFCQGHGVCVEPVPTRMSAARWKERLSYTLQCTAVVSGSGLGTVSLSSGLYHAALVYAAFGNATVWVQPCGYSSGGCSSGNAAP